MQVRGAKHGKSFLESFDASRIIRGKRRPQRKEKVVSFCIGVNFLGKSGVALADVGLGVASAVLASLAIYVLV